MKTFLAVLALLALAATASAQTIVGGTGGATMVLKDGDVSNVGSVLGEVEWQWAWSDAENPRHWGGLVSFIGVSTDGGGEQVGVGYRHYIRSGGVYPFFGIGGFTLGTNTPKIDELSVFGGFEAGIEVPISETDDDKVTGFVGVYPSIAGQADTMVLRAGVRAAMN